MTPIGSCNFDHQAVVWSFESTVHLDLRYDYIIGYHICGYYLVRDTLVTFMSHCLNSISWTYNTCIPTHSPDTPWSHLGSNSRFSLSGIWTKGLITHKTPQAGTVQEIIRRQQFHSNLNIFMSFQVMFWSKHFLSFDEVMTIRHHNMTFMQNFNLSNIIDISKNIS